MDKKQKAILNMAKFLKSQSLDLLGRLDELNLDKHAELCERVHILHETLSQEFKAYLDLIVTSFRGEFVINKCPI